MHVAVNRFALLGILGIWLPAGCSHWVPPSARERFDARVQCAAMAALAALAAGLCVLQLPAAGAAKPNFVFVLTVRASLPLFS